ncbi:hypothetical protein OPT61_g9655 [Boeremia exigua]|uniref:Uncharacterized protein n=1 Tax=Boeremia exigua TaxID=749465 RepID=A0ACC2HU38_9PLEO|nr:hypothetical protein OPT61_g9655 [Boeremia exigua]
MAPGLLPLLGLRQDAISGSSEQVDGTAGWCRVTDSVKTLETEAVQYMQRCRSATPQGVKGSAAPSLPVDDAACLRSLEPDAWTSPRAERIRTHRDARNRIEQHPLSGDMIHPAFLSFSMHRTPQHYANITRLHHLILVDLDVLGPGCAYLDYPHDLYVTLQGTSRTSPQSRDLTPTSFILRVAHPEDMNSTMMANEPEWSSKPAWKLPGWAEPLMVASILFGAMALTRRRNYRIFDRSAGSTSVGYLDSDSHGSSDALLSYPSDEDDLSDVNTTKFPPKEQHTQSHPAALPVPDRDVLLDHQLCVLPPDGRALSQAVRGEGHLGCVAGARNRSVGGGRARHAELPVPRP